MFAGFSFDREVSDTHRHVLDDSNISPTDNLSRWVLPYHRANGTEFEIQVDRLAHTLSWQRLDGRSRCPYPTPPASQTATPMAAASPEAIASIDGFSPPASVSSPAPSPGTFDAHEEKHRTLSAMQELEMEKMLLQPDSKRLRRQMGTQFTNHPANTRTIQSLMETMIENGLQCNVQSPISASSMQSLPSDTDFNSSVGLDESNEPMLDISLPLEVDVGYCEDDDGGLYNDIHSFRQGSSAAGVRKHSVNYRSASQAALHCNRSNMKKNKPRMRRRPKTKPHHHSSSAAVEADNVSAS